MQGASEDGERQALPHMVAETLAWFFASALTISDANEYRGSLKLSVFIGIFIDHIIMFASSSCGIVYDKFKVLL
jgi:hypothetical protein